jgi:hypothetical protein
MPVSEKQDALEAQQVEAPEVVLDRQHFARGGAGVVCVAADRFAAEHGARARRARPDNSHRQAVEDAKPVEETLGLARGRDEPVFGALVADEDEASAGEESSRRAQRVDRYDMSCSASKIVTSS